MTEKWNVVAFGGEGSNQAANGITVALEDEGVSPTRLQTENGTNLVRVPGYCLPNSDSIRAWLIDQMKVLETLPEWAVVTHANTTEDGGRAWVFKNHDGYMDLIDIVLGHNTVFGEDVETYLENSHGVDVPVWMASSPDDEAVSVGSIGKAMGGPSEQTLQQILARYPMFDIPGTLSDPVEETRPDSERTGLAVTEQRSVVLDTGEMAFIQTSLQDYTDYDADRFIEERFSDGTFTGTWEEFTETFWDALDAVLSGLSGADLGRETEMDVRGQANTIKWQSAIDWHQ